MILETIVAIGVLFALLLDFARKEPKEALYERLRYAIGSLFVRD